MFLLGFEIEWNKLTRRVESAITTTWGDSSGNMRINVVIIIGGYVAIIIGGFIVEARGAGVEWAVASGKGNRSKIHWEEAGGEKSLDGEWGSHWNWKGLREKELDCGSGFFWSRVNSAFPEWVIYY
jgi:hypothetical protein